jgi:hypothetical protein
MVHNAQSYWIFGLCSSFRILKTKGHNVSEAESLDLTS